MSIGETLLDIAKYIIPAIIVLIASSMIVGKFLTGEYKRKQLAVFQEGQGVTMRLRLQAYERLTVFLERSHPRELIPRVYIPGMTVRELQTVAVNAINSEFEHNLSQQIYVSTNVWNTVMTAKQQEVAMINQIALTLNPEENAKELNAKIASYLISQEQATPAEIALETINNEAKMVMYQQA
ncbi:MAG TPA: hypothetical protein VLZ83_05230 [Edaphocola sp.]|nr:hypothetical protein [Edaphocola sp.]